MHKNSIALNQNTGALSNGADFKKSPEAIFDKLNNSINVTSKLLDEAETNNDFEQYLNVVDQKAQDLDEELDKYTHIAINQAGWFYFLENPYLPNKTTIKIESSEDGEVTKEKVINCLVLGEFLEGGTIFLSELERYSSIYQLKKPIEYSRAYEILERCQNNQGITTPISYNPSLFWDNIKHKQDLYLLDYALIITSSKNKWCKRLACVYSTDNKKRGIKLGRRYLTADHPPIYTSSMGLRTMLWQILTTDKQLVKELAVKS